MLAKQALLNVKKVTKAIVLIVLVFLGIHEHGLAVINCSTKDSTILLTSPNGTINNTTAITNFNGKINVPATVGTTVTGSALGFASGQIQTQNGQSGFFSGAIDPASSTKLTLSGSQSLYINDGNCSQGVNVSGASNKLYIGTSYSGSIVLANSGASLSISSKCPISNSIALGGGTLTLASSLVFDSTFGPTGGGTILLNNNSLTLDQFALTTAITIKGPGAVFLRGNNSTTAIITIDNTLGPVAIYGPGNLFLSASAGAISVIGAGRTFIKALTISNISTAATNNISVAAVSELEFEDCALELVANLTFSSGKIFFSKRNFLACPSTFVLVAQNAGTIIFVGAGELLYERYGAAALYPLTIASSGQVIYDPLAIVQPTVVTNGAAGIAGPAGTAGTVEASSSITANTTLTRDYNLQSTSTFRYRNTTPGTPRTITLNYSNFAMYFNYSTSPYMTIDQNTSARFQNVFIYGFDNALCSFGASSSLFFLDNTYLCFTKDTKILSTDMPWTIGGNVFIDGNGFVFNLANASNLIVSSTASKTVTMSNMIFKPLHPTAYQQTLSTNVTVFQDMDIYIPSSGFNMTNGNFNIRGTVRFLASGQTSATDTRTVTLSSAGNLVIESGAKLIIGPGVTFEYTPNIGGNTVPQAKAHVVMTDLSSTLELDNCIISSQSPGIGLYSGRLVIKNLVKLNIATSVSGSEAEFGPNMIVEVCPSSKLLVQGSLTIT